MGKYVIENERESFARSNAGMCQAVEERMKAGATFGEAFRASLDTQAPEEPETQEAPNDVMDDVMKRWALVVLRFHRGNDDFDLPLEELLDWACAYEDPIDFSVWIDKRFPKPKPE